MEKAKLFFSYARENSDFVLKLAKDLRAEGVDLWLDQLDIAPGERRDKAIQEALENCETLLVILTPDSVVSQNVMDEVSFALEEEKHVVPILHTNCEISFRLRRLQRVDFSGDYGTGFTRLVKALNIENAPDTGHSPQRQVQPRMEGASSTAKPLVKKEDPGLDQQGTSQQDTGSSGAGRRKYYLVTIGVVVFVGILGIAVWMLDWGGPVIPGPSPDNSQEHDEQTTKNWFVILGSFKERTLAEDRILKLQTSGYQVSLIDTNQYANLTDGLWAVVLGPYGSEELANIELKKVLNIISDAYVKPGK